MGLLEDAIREHMKLKRSHGASQDTIARIEDEAFGSGGRKQPSRITAMPKESVESESPAAIEPVEAEVKAETEAPLEETVSEPEAPQEPVAETAETEAQQEPVAEPEAAESHEQAQEPLSSIEGSEPESDESDDGQVEEPGDLLEETPEFLEETPEGERLWFEQRPPKDFDFND